MVNVELAAVRLFLVLGSWFLVEACYAAVSSLIAHRSSATKWLTYSSLIRSSAEIPACFNMPDKVPVLSSLCSGTTHPLSPRRRTTWLPRCRTSTNPSLINALQQSLPAIRGSLGMGQLKAGHHGRGTKVHGELLQKQSSRLLEVCHSFG